MKKKQTSKEFFKKIDFSLLKKQKDLLLKHIEDIDDIETLEALEGIICLINGIQDHVVDDLGLYSEDEVFDFQED